MNISIKSMPDSLTASIAKEHVYNAAEVVLFSSKSPLRKTVEIVAEAVQLIFKSLLAIPLDLLYIPIAFTAKKIWDKKHADDEKEKFFHIEAVPHWSGKKGESEIPVSDAMQLMKQPEVLGKRTIKLPIARCDHLRMREKDLPEILELANKYSLNVPCERSNITSRYFGSFFKDTYIHRPNHNGTHSGRQLRLVEVLYDFIEKHGSEASRAIVESLTEEEKLNLKLAEYFCRAGRVDETGWNDKIVSPDRAYKIRSANIYEAYARQLYSFELADPSKSEHAEKMIAWTSEIQVNSSTYQEKNFTALSPKDVLCRDILQLAHKVEQIRCADEEKFEHEMTFISRFLANLIGKDEETAVRLFWPPLLQFGKDLCSATGVGRAYDKVPFNKKLFRICSHSAKTCLDRVRSVELSGLPGTSSRSLFHTSA